MQSFISELRRRNVLRMAAFYAAAGWLLVQVATQVFPFFDIPNWTVRLVVVAIVIGFPAAVLFSWFYELTPQGIKLESEVARDASITRATGRKLDRWIIAVLALAVVLLLADKLVLHRAASEAPAAASAGDKSIAVLPFENLSDDKANAYFADGIQDEILTRLARIGQLKVISRTSTQQYASKPGNLSDIGRQLGVANILEGSVQKAGDAVHINVQLIRAASDEHLWADSYNRKLDDIFGVEGEVAQTIAETLKATLSGAEAQGLKARPTANPQAYDAYLRGIAFLYRGGALTPSVSKAIDALQEAVRLDPDFGNAWARLSVAHGVTYWRSDHSAAHRQAAREALDAAKRLAPDSEETVLADGYYRYWVERDYEGAKPLFERARQIAPSDDWPIYALAAIDRRQGRWPESLELFGQAVTLNPRGGLLLSDAAATALSMRDLKAAQRFIDLGLDAAPDDAGILAQQAVLFQEAGDLAQAQKTLDAAHIEVGDDIIVPVYCTNATLQRRYAPAIALLKTQLAQPEVLGINLGLFQTWLGDLQRNSGDAAAARDTYTQARAGLQAVLQKEPDNDELVSAIAEAEAGLGNKAAALEQIQHAIALMPASRDAYVGPVYEEAMARIQARFGDKDAAIAALQHLLVTSYSPPPVTPALLRLDPDWDKLRGAPRFEKLAAGAPP